MGTLAAVTDLEYHGQIATNISFLYFIRICFLLCICNCICICQSRMMMVTLADVSVTDLEYHGQIASSGITAITDLHTQAPRVSLGYHRQSGGIV